MLSVDQLNF